ncbi:MAG: hypothetical protein IJM09_04710 [Neisseriaceae bacterium]|nr:hypothetical protein [Neisseriaceae bacterium]
MIVKIQVLQRFGGIDYNNVQSTTQSIQFKMPMPCHIIVVSKYSRFTAKIVKAAKPFDSINSTARRGNAEWLGYKAMITRRP